MFNKGGLGNLMKQAQQMQENMAKAQEALATVEVEGQAGAGMVKVTMTCNHAVKRIHIDDSLLQDDKDMLEDLIVAALNDATRKVETTTSEKNGGLYRRHEPAAWLQDAVLSAHRPGGRRPVLLPLLFIPSSIHPESPVDEYAVFFAEPDRRIARVARRWPQVGQPHGVSPVAARSAWRQ